MIGVGVVGLLVAVVIVGCAKSPPGTPANSPEGVSPPPAPAAPDPGPAADPGSAEAADLSGPGTWRSGLWEYSLIVTAPGSKSEGLVGKLLYGGKPVPEGVPGDYYRTPWGDILWVGDPVVLWGEHGWMPRPAGSTGGRLLPEPWRMAGGPVVMATVLVPADEMPAGDVTAAWLAEGMRKLGVPAWRTEAAWFALTDQAITVHDTKMIGTLSVRLSPAVQADRLVVRIGGTEAGRVELAREDGATALVHRRLGIVRPQDFYLAFRVDRAAADWPAPLVVGPDADGREVIVEGTREVVIRLPGDRSSGLVWTVEQVQGEGPRTSSVVAAGEPQFTPAADGLPAATQPGTFENVFRVVETGRTHVELSYRRPWQPDAPAEKTFRVDLAVRSLPGVPAPR